MPIIKHTASGEVRVVSIEAVRLVDGPMIEQCYREIVEVVDKTEEKCVLLHFGRVAFMSSSALGMLVRIHKKCKEYNVDLKLSDIIPDIRQVFKLTALEKVFDIHGDLAQAMDAFKKGGRLSFRKKAPASYEVSDGG